MRDVFAFSDLSILFNDHPTPMLVILKEGFEIKEVNNSGCKLFSQKRSELLGLLFVDLFPGCKRRLLEFSKSRSKGFFDVGNFPYLLTRGKHLVIHLSCKNTSFEGKPCWLVVATDVTESRRAEKLSEDFHDAIVNSSIVSRADIKGIITYVNENFVRVSGYSKEELIGKNHRIINSGYHTEQFWSNMWNTISTGQMWQGDVKNKTKNGNYYWVDTFIMPLLDESGRVKEYLSVRKDITARKRAKDELNLANLNLSETLIFGKMGSAELCLKTFNITMSKELLKLMEEEVEGQRILPLTSFLEQYVAPEYESVIHEKIAEGISKLTAEKSIVELEFEMITAQKKRLWISAKGIFKREAAWGILHDISHEKKAMETIKESELKYKQLHDKKEMLIKEIHHRVKNNLQLISSMLYLKMQECNNPESQGFMTSMREKIKSVSLIHERLLETESLNSIDISEYLQKLLHDIQVTYYRDDLQLNIRTNIERLNFCSDQATYLGQLVNELVINAIKHGFRNRSSGEISVTLERNGRVVELIVEDNGVGYPEDNDPARDKSYGMQLVQIFVRQLKGRIELIRRRGTCFKIEFAEKY